ncbi:uncharacterized protein LOC135462106 [Liolophura sinensis]|uniref:uncharacterized protein LOC135462106 n=1 Tax=Liolophura sinensis TaxID=3198878 RepID=UPI003158C7D3
MFADTSLSNFVKMSKRDFGSFHSSNAEELINASEACYKPPDQPFDVPTFTEYHSESIQFGAKCRQKHFYLEVCYKPPDQPFDVPTFIACHSESIQFGAKCRQKHFYLEACYKPPDQPFDVPTFTEYHSESIQFGAKCRQRHFYLEACYKPPDQPFDVPTFTEYHSESIQFGAKCRQRHFYLEDSCTFINHGAMGAVLKEAMEVAQKWQIYTESQPLRVIDRELIPQLVHSARRLAKFVNCDPSELVLVANVSSALSAVVNSLQFQPGEKIFCLSVTYGALKKLLRHRCSETEAVIQEELVQFPLTGKQQVLDLVKDKLEPGTKLAVFDHIPSNTPFVMPLEEIIPLCKERGVPVLIDGAHALGSLPLNLAALGADYYTSNAHKWLCAPKGCAFLYARKELQHDINPCVISHGFEGGFHSKFIWQGLKDYSAFIALRTVLDFWEVVKPENIRLYINSLTKDAATMLTKCWDTALAAPEDMFRSMCLVQLPAALYQTSSTVNYNTAEEIQSILFHRYNIEVPIKAVQGELYVRISAHIYNQMSDYETLAEAITQLVKEKWTRGNT